MISTLGAPRITPSPDDEWFIFFGARRTVRREGKETRSSRASLRAEEFHLEDEGGVGRDDGGEPAGTVGVVGSARELGVLADGHLHHALVPALDDLALADDELERSAAVLGGVELAAVHERAWGRADGRGEVRRGGKRAGDGLGDASETRGDERERTDRIQPPTRTPRGGTECRKNWNSGGRARGSSSERTGVVRGHGLAGLGEGDPVPGLKSLDVHAHVGRRRAMMCAEGTYLSETFQRHVSTSSRTRRIGAGSLFAFMGRVVQVTGSRKELRTPPPAAAHFGARGARERCD